MGLTLEARIAKAAKLYLDNEKCIKSECRNYEGPTKRTVGIFVKSLFQPPHGTGQATIDGVLEAIPQQRKKREHRKANPPGVWSKRRKASRIKAVAPRLYTIHQRSRKDDPYVVQPHDCIALGSVNGYLVALDKGTSGGYIGSNRTIYARLFVKNRETGMRKVFVMDTTKASHITSAMQALAPKGVLRLAFTGSRITFDPVREGFDVDGTFHPFRGVLKVYHGDEVHNMKADEERAIAKNNQAR